MLPKRIREILFEKTSVKTMRYVRAVRAADATGLVKRSYDMIAEDFFINGSLTSHSQVPELLAGTWMSGREIVLVTDRLDRTTKEAMGATLSYVNDCPYCADMLVSLVHGSGQHRAASSIFREEEAAISDPVLRSRLEWVRQVAVSGPQQVTEAPFSAEEMPEAIGTMFTLNYVNRFSHVAMDGSPVAQVFKNTALRLFGYELRETTERRIAPGRGLDLLPAAPVPDDLAWARSNPRIADTLSRWAAAVEREASQDVSAAVQQAVQHSLQSWQGETMPISRSWVDDEVRGLTGTDRDMARLALVVAKASYQVDKSLIEAVLVDDRSEPRLIRVLAYASFSAARRLASLAASRLNAWQLRPGEGVSSGAGNGLSAKRH